MIEKTPNYDFTVMLEEAQDKLKRQFASMNTMREHGKVILGSSSIIVSLFALFKISTYQIKTDFISLYFILIGLMAFFYFLLIYFSITATLPNSLKHAILPTWEYYTEIFKDQSDRAILENRVYLYLNAIKENESKLENQYEISKNLNRYMILLVATVLLVAFLMPFMQA
ncbi:MAG: hypothetical protein JNM55_10235 [Anaerolineales bacterium]|nr:hypothetical protein [Anaerolineales bacterium]